MFNQRWGSAAVGAVPLRVSRALAVSLVLSLSVGAVAAAGSGGSPTGRPPGGGTGQTVLQGQYVRLNGAHSQLANGKGGPSFSWKIVSAPAGSKAKLLEPASEQPWIEPDLPGTYRFRLVVTSGAASRGGRLRAVTAGSNDDVTLRVQPSSPFGISLQSNSDGQHGGIKLGGVALPGTVRPSPGGFSYAVLDRTTLQTEESGETKQPTVASDLDELMRIAKRHSDGGSIMIVNFVAYLDRDDRDKLRAIFKQIGGGELPADDNFTQQLPGSMIGISGAPAGVAFIDHRDVNKLPDPGDMIGYLRLNQVTRLFDFVFADQVAIDTAASQTATEPQITVGDHTYTGSHPANVSGFQMLRLDPKTLDVLANFTYVTNAQNGGQQPSEQTRLANDLEYSTTQVERPLVILQSYGEPTGYSAEWDRAAQAIQKLGGTRQVFDDLNQPNVGGDDEHGRKGGYGFIGRVGSSAPQAEVSYPLDGVPARLKGLLMRSRTDDYEPSLVSSARSNGTPPVNEELVNIVNQVSRPFPELAPSAPRDEAQAAENFLGGPLVMGVCSADVTCNVRQTYYTNYNGSWGTIAGDLQDAKAKCQRPHPGFKDWTEVCDAVRTQLFREVQMANRVRHYLGPEGLQQPFGAAGVAALANLAEISNEIQEAVKPPPADNTTSNALNIVASLFNIASAVSAVQPTAGAVASGLGGVFGLSGYLTNQDNGPNLIGPQVQTAVSKLGVMLATRYQDADDQLDGLGRMIVSNYGKLEDVAGKVDSDPSWILGSPATAREQLVQAAKQTISEALIPKAWPVLYDLGYPTHRQAREWNCYWYVAGTHHKFLFADEPDGGQVGMRFPKTDWNPIMALGGVHAIGHLTDSRIPTPPASVINKLFESPKVGGLGLKKLEFYNPTLFRFFPSNPRRTNDESISLGADKGGEGTDCDLLPDPPGDSG